MVNNFKYLASDYIAGKDIIGYDIDELENNTDFMIEVLKQSKDIKMINFSSDEVQKDFNFVKYIIENFNDDIKWLNKFVDRYLSSLDLLDPCYIETNFLMENVTKNTDYFTEYQLKIGIFYWRIRDWSTPINKNTNNSFPTKERGMGYIIVLAEYNTNLIKKQMAKLMLEEIFYGKNMVNLEEKIHNDFKSKANLEHTDINGYLANIIRNYDENLADYTLTNLKSLEFIKLMIKKIIDNWENYIRERNFKKTAIVFDFVETFLELYTYDINFDCYIELNEIIKTFNLEEFFEETSLRSEIDDNYVDWGTTQNDTLKSKFKQNLSKLLISLFSKDIIDEDYISEEFYYSKGKAKLLEIKPKSN